MNFKYLLPLAVLAAGLAACDETDEPQAGVLSLEPQELTFAADAAEPQTVEVRTDAAQWSAVPDEGGEWITLAQSGDALTVSAGRWADPETGREAQVIVTAGELSARLTVKQLASPKPAVRIYIADATAPPDMQDWGGQLQAVSQNGMWAVGTNDYLETAFVWSRQTGEFAFIEGDGSYAYGVADDGTVVGQYTNEDGNLVPARWKDGVWTPLERMAGVPERYDSEWAASISADGRIVTGQLAEQVYSPELDKNVFRTWPVVWTDGVLQPWFETMPAVDVLQQGGWAWDGSEDGRVIAGVADFTTGRRSPAVWVNGVLTRIYGTEDSGDNFYDGACAKVSPDGRYVTGYFSPDGSGMDAIGFVYDTSSASSEEIDGMGLVTAVTDDGTVFGQDGYMGSCYVRPAGGSVQTLSDYLSERYLMPSGDYETAASVLDVSSDGRVLVGYYIVSSDMVGALAMPWVAVIE